ncbi:MAG: glycosyltransferase family 2 protein [Sedimentisphaerales bacterium]|nr:glycosyltransferase family 2 protein [Sedimentisphaerales bacterium]
MSTRQIISLVIPVYCEEQVVDETYRRLKEVLNSIADVEHELIFVDDGSTDSTLEKLKALSQQDSKVKIISFSRNFGHQIAITAGMDHARGDAVIVIDADLQDPPEVISQMLDLWRQGYQVVHGKRARRKGESLFKLATASVFYRLLARLTDIKIPLDSGDFKLMDRKVIDVLKRLREKHRFVRGLVAWTGFKQVELPYERDKRFAGQTKYPLRKMLKFALDGITAFSIKPLKVALNLGFFSVFVGLLLTVYVVVQRLVHPDTTVPGWASLLIVMIFFGGIQLITLGVVGEYIGRIYDESRDRPLYIVGEEINFDSTDSES